MTAVLEPTDVLPVDAEGKPSVSWPLVQRAQQGDMDAYGQIYAQYSNYLFRFLHFRVGNREVAEDLTQEAFLRALRRIGTYTWQGRDFSAWLVTIAKNLAADHFKSGRYRLESPVGLRRDDQAVDETTEGSPESAVVDHITNTALMEAVKQLNPEQRECIVLRFLRGLSVRQVAEAMGKNEGAIKALQYRAVRALGRGLDLADPDDLSAGFICSTRAVPVPAPAVTEPVPAAAPAAAPAEWEPTEDVLGTVEVEEQSAPSWMAEVDWSPAAVRQWARDNQLPVGPRGVPKRSIRESYAQAAARRAGVSV